VRVRLVSFGLVLGVAFLLTVSLVLEIAIQAVGMLPWANSPLVIVGEIIQLVIGLVFLSAAFGALLKFLPDAPVLWRDALVGGIVAALLFSAGKELFALYLTHAGTASAFGAAGSLAVLLMWLYFSAAVLLLGAEFSAARARMRDPRGAWGQQDGHVLPGSRAKIGLLLAASTRRAAPGSAACMTASRTPAGRRADAPIAASARQAIGTRAQDAQQLPGQARRNMSAVAQALELSRKIQRAESIATRAAALAMLGARRKASHASDAVRRHPWRAVLVAAGAAMVLALLSHGDSVGQDHTNARK
jgi:membrane protein